MEVEQTTGRVSDVFRQVLEWQRSIVIERQRLRRELGKIRFEEYRNREKESEAENTRNSRQVNQ